MSTKKHILFSVAGMSPAIITETLFGLWESKVTGGEIHLLTTSHGKTSMQVLLSEKGQIAAFNRMYKTSWEIRSAWIETLRDPHSNQPLKDLRSFADNENAANAIVERVHHWTQQANIVLHASIADGRKTMGIYLYYTPSQFELLSFRREEKSC
jgi:CRISPR-associated protein (TIGR02584 family)